MVTRHLPLLASARIDLPETRHRPEVSRMLSVPVDSVIALMVIDLPFGTEGNCATRILEANFGTLRVVETMLA